MKWDKQEFIWCVHERSLLKFLFVDNQKKNHLLEEFNDSEKTWFQGLWFRVVLLVNIPFDLILLLIINKMVLKIQYLLWLKKTSKIIAMNDSRDLTKIRLFSHINLFDKNSSSTKNNGRTKRLLIIYLFCMLFFFTLSFFSFKFKCNI